jgi:hypothetical protein
MKTKLYLLTLIIALFFLAPLSSSAQKKNDRHLQMSAGYGLHGSGDLKGVVFGTEFTKYKSEKLSLNYNLRAGIHFGKDKILLINQTAGTTTDQSIRYTTAGVQLGINAGLSPVRTLHHEIAIALGPFGRFQSASNGSDGYSLYYPNATGIPSVLVEYNNRTPQNTFALGGLLQLKYTYTTGKGLSFALSPGFQTDTNGDAIPQALLLVGKRF